MTNFDMQMESRRRYICVDLKSFYASVECVQRGLDPLTTNLVVADETRTNKTICLAVSPSLKEYGVGGRARLFEVVSKVKEINAFRRIGAKDSTLIGESYDANELKQNKNLGVSYIVAPPRMALYMKYSTDIYQVYLKYIAPEDIHVYSVDEVFMDVTSYLNTYKLSAHQLAKKIIQDIYSTTGITATAGIGTNMYLAKIAMDIVAKHIAADSDGVRIAYLDEMNYRSLLWNHRPLTDFWRVGRGYAKKLEQYGMYTMGDIARCSLGALDEYHNEDLLFKLFGINAELLIDHAWGYEPCTIKEVKAYKPENNSISLGQVLQEPYDVKKAKVVVMEMADSLVLDMVDKGLVADQIVLNIGYDIENLFDDSIANEYKGEITTDRYGRKIPKQAHGSINLGEMTSSTKLILDKTEQLFEQIVNEKLLIRRMNVVANHVVPTSRLKLEEKYEQLTLFDDANFDSESEKIKKEELSKEKKIQQALIDIKKKYGKNAILKGLNFEEGATGKQRNAQIGGHKA